MTDYREFLYGSYVSSNKKWRRRSDALNAPRIDRAQLWRLRNWLRDVDKQSRLLDLGCGAGDLLLSLRSIGFQRVLGVEGSHEQVAIARTTLSDVVIESDIFDYLRQAAPANADLVFMFDVLEHLTRPEAIELLQLVHRTLTPGGRLILQLPNGDSSFALSVFASDLTHETLYTSISLRHLLEASGFSDCRFEERGPVPLTLLGIVRLLAWKTYRNAIKLRHLMETGAESTGIYTRVFACRSTRD